ncbi:hypothetical protein INT43_003063 [Umbelopsis isabellina]|uniref:Uncharacterized protein n=1 Tax=Mortierella isabellina TaxID=91625 RepID=A0A8H7U9Z4_MORIS|nr:hypothetical protein INT43_003063 [Umbelopsis isabellina]
MEGIKKRKNPSTPLEDQAEFLDEQEQERLVSDLRKENEKSNRSIQRGLAGLSILVSSLYLLFLKELIYPAQALAVPMIPIPSREPITSETNYPGFAATISLVSLALSFYIILLNSGLSVLSLAKSVVSKDVEQGTPQSASLVVMGNIIVSLIPPLLSYSVSLKELIFWTLPLLVLLMDLLALQMMDNVNQELGGLESSKYKYKGA